MEPIKALDLSPFSVTWLSSLHYRAGEIASLAEPKGWHVISVMYNGNGVHAYQKALQEALRLPDWYDYLADAPPFGDALELVQEEFGQSRLLIILDFSAHAPWEVLAFEWQQMLQSTSYMLAFAKTENGKYCSGFCFMIVSDRPSHVFSGISDRFRVIRSVATE